MRSFLLAFSLLLATASAARVSALDYLVHLAANTCTSAGQTVCNQDCNEVILCVADGEGGFREVLVEECSADTRCSAEAGRCVVGSTACGASSQGYIECHDTGYFPDPYNCTLYHLCLMENSISIMYQCDASHAYNPGTDDCSFQTTDAVCVNGPVPACTSVGQTGALVTNPSIYYVCTGTADKVLIPQLYRCHNGLVYDPTAYGCVASTTTSATSTTTTPTTPTPPTPPPPPPAQRARRR